LPAIERNVRAGGDILRELFDPSMIADTTANKCLAVHCQ